MRAALEAFGVDLSASIGSIPGEAIAALLGGQLAPPTDEPFAGSVHALIGPRTFSSAQLFAVLLRDNGFGSLFGEPSGNAASFWGQDYAIEISGTELLEVAREDIAASEDRVLAAVLAALADSRPRSRRGAALEDRLGRTDVWRPPRLQRTRRSGICRPCCAVSPSRPS